MRTKNSNTEIAEGARRQRRRPARRQHLFSVASVTPLRPLCWRLVFGCGDEAALCLCPENTPIFRQAARPAPIVGAIFMLRGVAKRHERLCWRLRRRRPAPLHALVPQGAGNDRHRWGIQLVSRFIVRPMVQQRKLIGGVSRHFHHPSCHFRGKPVLQTNDLLGSLSVFGHFLSYQILPNSTKSVQRRGSNRASNWGFGRSIYLNRAKSRGACQAVTRGIAELVP